MSKGITEEVATAQGQPRTARQYLPNAARPVATGAQACRRLAEATTYWLGTVRPDGRPHVVPVLSVWLDGALYFCAGATTTRHATSPIEYEEICYAQANCLQHHVTGWLLHGAR